MYCQTQYKFWTFNDFHVPQIALDPVYFSSIFLRFSSIVTDFLHKGPDDLWPCYFGHQSQTFTNKMVYIYVRNSNSTTIFRQSLRFELWTLNPKMYSNYSLLMTYFDFVPLCKVFVSWGRFHILFCALRSSFAHCAKLLRQ